MQNERYLTNPDAWLGFDDALVAWRVLYDEKFLYIAVDFFDDQHSEGRALEPWWKVDMVEISIQPGGHDFALFVQGGGCNIRSQKEYFYRWTRKFTQAHNGLVCYTGKSNQCNRYPKISPGESFGGLTNRGVDHGSPDCGEAEFYATPITSDLSDLYQTRYGADVTTRYDAPWSMEARIPLASFSKAFLDAGYTNGGWPPDPGRRSRFLMDLVVNDDEDSADIDDSRYGTYMSLRRYAEWWGTVDAHFFDNWSNPRFYPYWAYAGERSGLKQDDWPFLPDLVAYYGLEETIDDLGEERETFQIDEFFKGIVANGFAISDPIAIDGKRKRGRGGKENIIAFSGPNPFNVFTTIHLTVPSPKVGIQVEIFDAHGKLIQDLSSKIMNGQVNWHGLDGNGNAVPSGIYFFKVSSGPLSQMGKMILAK